MCKLQGVGPEGSPPSAICYCEVYVADLFLNLHVHLLSNCIFHFPFTLKVLIYAN